MKDELGRPMTLLVKAAIPKNCKTEASESFPNKKEIRRPLLVDRCDQNDHIDSEKRTCERIAVNPASNALWAMPARLKCSALIWLCWSVWL